MPTLIFSRVGACPPCPLRAGAPGEKADPIGHVVSRHASGLRRRHLANLSLWGTFTNNVKFKFICVINYDTYFMESLLFTFTV